MILFVLNHCRDGKEELQIKLTKLLIQPRGLADTSAWNLAPKTKAIRSSVDPSEDEEVEEKGKVVVLWTTCLYDRSVTLTSQKGPLNYFNGYTHRKRLGWREVV